MGSYDSKIKKVLAIGKFSEECIKCIKLGKTCNGKKSANPCLYFSGVNKKGKIS